MEDRVDFWECLRPYRGPKLEYVEKPGSSSIRKELQAIEYPRFGARFEVLPSDKDGGYKSLAYYQFEDVWHDASEGQDGPAYFKNVYESAWDSDAARQARLEDLGVLMKSIEAVQESFPEMSPYARTSACSTLVRYFQPHTMNMDSFDRHDVEPLFNHLGARVGPLQEGFLDYMHATCEYYTAEMSGASPDVLDSAREKLLTASQNQIYGIMDVYGREGVDLSHSEREDVRTFVDALKANISSNRDFSEERHTGVYLGDFRLPIAYDSNGNHYVDVLDASKPGVAMFETREFDACSRSESHEKYAQLMAQLDEYQGPRLTYMPARASVLRVPSGIIQPGEGFGDGGWYAFKYSSAQTGRGMADVHVFDTEGYCRDQLDAGQPHPWSYRSEDIGDRVNDFHDLKANAEAVQAALPDLSAEERKVLCERIGSDFLTQMMNDEYGSRAFASGDVQPVFNNFSARTASLQDGFLDYIKAGCDCYAAMCSGAGDDEYAAACEKFESAALDQIYSVMSVYDKGGEMLSDSEQIDATLFASVLADSAYNNRYDDMLDGCAPNTGLWVSDFGVPVPSSANAHSFYWTVLDGAKPGVLDFECSGRCCCCRSLSSEVGRKYTRDELITGMGSGDGDGPRYISFDELRDDNVARNPELGLTKQDVAEMNRVYEEHNKNSEVLRQFFSPDAPSAGGFGYNAGQVVSAEPDGSGSSGSADDKAVKSGPVSAFFDKVRHSSIFSKPARDMRDLEAAASDIEQLSDQCMQNTDFDY